MHRIDHSTRAVDLFGPGKDGFTEGDPLTETAPTTLTADWANAVQEEFAAAIERVLPLAKASNFQLGNVIAAVSDAFALSMLKEGPTATNGFQPASICTSDDGLFMVAARYSDAVAPLVVSYDGGLVWADPTGIGAGPDAMIRAVAFGNEAFHAVGELGTIRYAGVPSWGAPSSLNSWTRRVVDNDFAGIFTHVHYWPAQTMWLAGGTDGGTGELQTSVDGGVTWTHLSVASEGTYGPFASDGNVLLVAVTSGILRTVNGTIWAPAVLDVPLVGRIVEISKVPGGWLAITTNASAPPYVPLAAYVSTDSENWTLVDPELSYMSSWPCIDANTGSVLGPVGATYPRLVKAAGIALGQFADASVIAMVPVDAGIFARRTPRRWFVVINETLFFSPITIY